MTSCWARYRYAPNTWSDPSTYWNDIEEIYNNGNDHNNNIHESDLLQKSVPATYKAKKSLRQNSHLGNEERKKKYLTDLTNSQDGHSLQGLWFIPGRR